MSIHSSIVTNGIFFPSLLSKYVQTDGTHTPCRNKGFHLVLCHKHRSHLFHWMTVSVWLFGAVLHLSSPWWKQAFNNLAVCLLTQDKHCSLWLKDPKEQTAMRNTKSAALLGFIIFTRLSNILRKTFFYVFKNNLEEKIL